MPSGPRLRLSDSGRMTGAQGAPTMLPSGWQQCWASAWQAAGEAVGVGVGVGVSVGVGVVLGEGLALVLGEGAGVRWGEDGDEQAAHVMAMAAHSEATVIRSMGRWCAARCSRSTGGGRAGARARWTAEVEQARVRGPHRLTATR